MNESEQAQAIAEIRERHGWVVLTYENETQPGDGADAHHDRATLLEIVDSQAQKIAAQKSAIESLEIIIDETSFEKSTHTGQIGGYVDTETSKKFESYCAALVRCGFMNSSEVKQ